MSLATGACFSALQPPLRPDTLQALQVGREAPSYARALTILQRMGFERTTPVQQAAVPLLLQHKVAYGT
jgi:superfamily II DNA/RNA helicase